MNNFDRLFIIVLSSILMTNALYAQDDVDVDVQILDSAVVSGSAYTSPLKGINTGTIEWNTKMLDNLPNIMGNADPLHYMQLLSSVQTNTEYDAGMYIQGCDNTHNNISIDGATVYNPSHLLGFFSAFNGPHFSSIKINNTATNASHSNRLGGFVDMQSLARNANCENDSFSAQASVGLISSQATLSIPLGDKFAVYTSLRNSYLNLLYKDLLVVDDGNAKYDFGDYNFTGLYMPNRNNRIWIDGYWGRDEIDYTGNVESMSMNGNWGNKLLSFHYNRKHNAIIADYQLYTTNYKAGVNLADVGYGAHLTSHISDVAAKVNIKGNDWNLGTDVLFHSIQPQKVSISSSAEYKDFLSQKQHSIEYSLYGQYKFLSLKRISSEFGCRMNLYDLKDQKTFFSCDPNFLFTYTTEKYNKLRFNYTLKHQYIAQTGFSAKNLPTEFWTSTGQFTKPQYSHGGTLTYDVDLFNNKLHFMSEVYGKLMRHQIEYVGNVYDFFYDDKYDLNEILSEGKGYNYGINLMLNKQTGAVTAWISAMLGRSLRRFDEYGLFPSSHERLYELNAVLYYNFTKRFKVGATMVMASGTPFTAPDYFYVFNTRLISHISKYNSNRLGEYRRVDLSLSYDLRKHKRYEHGINLSVYNVSCSKNTIFYELKQYEGGFQYAPVYFAVRVLPSISYYLRF